MHYVCFVTSLVKLAMPLVSTVRYLAFFTINSPDSRGFNILIEKILIQEKLGYILPKTDKKCQILVGTFGAQ